MVVLLKESWCIVSPTLEPRYQICARLHKKDPPGQIRQTKQLDKAINPLKHTLRTLRRYRIILEYFPFTLKEFGVTRELAIVLRDASIAHGKAATSAKFLHPDMSNRNIMFKRNGNGPQRYNLSEWVPGSSSRSDWCCQMKLESHSSKIELMTSNRFIINFDAMYKDPETGEVDIGTMRRANMKSGDLSDEAKFANGGIREVLLQMRHVLCQRYIDPEDAFGNSKKFEAQRKAAEVKKVEGLKALEDPNWLPNLLNGVLEEEKVDWVTNEARVDHGLGKYPNPPQQARQTKRLDKAINPLKHTLRTLRRYRIILEYFPFTLKESGVTRELAIVLRDASIAHGKAATSAKFLHPDMSNRNIMFKRNGNGPQRYNLSEWYRVPGSSSRSDWCCQMKLESHSSKIELMTSNRFIMKLTLRLHENFDTLYKDPETGEAHIGSARRSNIKSGDLSTETGFANDGIRTVLRRMQVILCQRYIDPEDFFMNDEIFEAKRKAAEDEKAEGLKALEDFNWLPNLLNEVLDDELVDWVTNEARVDHVLKKIPK
ncbi:hypothetical protein E4T56_gene16821 [Termitomyces sp. T112]|nr:hypothetical protein E4T56_gene16821 [Termitomyces sp. T112]